MTNEPTLAGLLELLAMNIRHSIYCHMPATIVTYDENTQTATVKPSLMTNFETEDGETHAEILPDIHGVPVVLPRGAMGYINMPVNPNDHCMLLFQDKSMDGWMQNGGILTDPKDLRSHDISDAVAMMGLYPEAKPLNAAINKKNISMGFETGKQIHITPTNTIHLGKEATTDFVALASKVLEELNVIANDINSLKNIFNAWVPFPNDGGAKLKADLVAAGYTASLITPKDVGSKIVGSE